MRAFIEEITNPSLSCKPNDFSKRRRVLPLQRYGIVFVPMSADFPNLGGNTDLVIVRPKLVWLRAFCIQIII